MGAPETAVPLTSTISLNLRTQSSAENIRGRMES